EVRASPQRAVRTEPTQPTAERPAARRVFAQQARWLRCSSVEDPRGIFSFPVKRGKRRAARLSSPKSSPSGLLRENSTPQSFQTGSKQQPQHSAFTSASRCGYLAWATFRRPWFRGAWFRGAAPGLTPAEIKPGEPAEENHDQADRLQAAHMTD